MVLPQKQGNQWNYDENPEINAHTYRHLSFDKESNEKLKIWNKAFPTNGAGLIGYLHVE